MRPIITSANITRFKILSVKVFELVAKSQHYKALFLLQKDSNTNLHQAITKILNNADFAEQCVKTSNDDKNYQSFMTDLIDNTSDFDNPIIPIRNCDFKVIKNENSISFFYIEERMAIHSYMGSYNMCILFVDDKSNKLFFSYENGDMMHYYEENNLVGVAYKNWLAEQELLK